MKIEQQKYKNIANKNFYLRYFCIFIFLFAIDRLSKIFFIHNPGYFKNFHIFQLSFSLNKNIAFSIAIPQIIIFFLIFLILIFLLYLLIKNLKKNNLLQKNFNHTSVETHCNASLQNAPEKLNSKFLFFLGLIIMGALSNLLDRIKFDGVVDFIYIPYFTVFNFADIYIAIGVALWLWEEKNHKKNRVV